MKRVIVIGAGAAGLGAALKMRRAVEAGCDLEFIVLEKDHRIGGKIVTEKVETAAGTFIVDGGSDTFLSSKPAVHRLAREIGVFDEELPTDDSRKKTLIVKRGRLYSMPDGVMQFAPTKFWPFATTGLFSWRGKLRAGMDLFIPRKAVPIGELNDETLEHFIHRRMGKEILDRLAEPIVGGVHASDPAVMSLAATFPSLLEMEQKYGCMIRGFLAQRKTAEQMRREHPPVPGAKPKTFFMSFNEGMQQFTDALTDEAGRGRIRMGVKVTGLARDANGVWTAMLSDGSMETADAVIIATEVWAAEDLVREFDARLAGALAQIPTSSSATVSVAFREDEIGIDLNAFGVLCPLVEERALMAATYSSTKWPGRAPKGWVLLRGFVGGPHNQVIMEESDEQLVQTVLSEFRSLLGVKPAAKPIFSRVFRWNGGMPQYTIGHLNRVALIEERASAIPGLALAGGGYRGVGIPNCIESGERAAAKVLADLGIDFA
ncbi:MAG: protoporphyrinogen oxidase [Coriobacteriia bacterium]|nr:protoporphyrinogen oxidase [Coriobacteriia bacterium]